MNQHAIEIIDSWAIEQYQKASTLQDVANLVERLRLAQADSVADDIWLNALQEQATFTPTIEPQPRDNFEQLAKIFKPTL